jgi:hypothetical protein
VSSYVVRAANLPNGPNTRNFSCLPSLITPNRALRVPRPNRRESRWSTCIPSAYVVATYIRLCLNISSPDQGGGEGP